MACSPDELSAKELGHGHTTGCGLVHLTVAQAGRPAEASNMNARGILSLVSHIIVAILAGIGSVATEWVTPVNRRDNDRL